MAITILAIAIAVMPLLLTLTLRTNGALAFLSLCAGSVLVGYVGDDVSLLAGALFHSVGDVNQVSKIALLVLPMLITLLLFRRSTAGKHMVLQLLSAAMAGLAALILVQPLLSVELQAQIRQTVIGGFVKPYEGFVFSLGVVISILTLWVARSKHGDHGSKKGKH